MGLYILNPSIPISLHNTVNCWLIVNITHSFNSNRRNYADAKEFCGTTAKNGFKTGRLLEPKTQSFDDKVYDGMMQSYRKGYNIIDHGH